MQASAVCYAAIPSPTVLSKIFMEIYGPPQPKNTPHLNYQLSCNLSLYLQPGAKHSRPSKRRPAASGSTTQQYWRGTWRYFELQGAEVFECSSASCDNVRQSLLPRWPWSDCMSAHLASNPSPVVTNGASGGLSNEQQSELGNPGCTMLCSVQAEASGCHSSTSTSTLSLLGSGSCP